MGSEYGIRGTPASYSPSRPRTNPGNLDPMSAAQIICARCAVANHPSTRFCHKCGLPLGSAQPDAEAGADALGPYEAPEPADPDTTRLVRQLVEQSGFEASPAGHGWQVVVPLQLDRHQAV